MILWNNRESKAVHTYEAGVLCEGWYHHKAEIRKVN